MSDGLRKGTMFGLPEEETFESERHGTVVMEPPEIFERPLRTRANGWHKWHASEGGCGRDRVFYIESATSERGTSERYQWELYCGICGRAVRWQDVLFVKDEWY